MAGWSDPTCIWYITIHAVVVVGSTVLLNLYLYIIILHAVVRVINFFDVNVGQNVRFSRTSSQKHIIFYIMYNDLGISPNSCCFNVARLNGVGRRSIIWVTSVTRKSFEKWFRQIILPWQSQCQSYFVHLKIDGKGHRISDVTQKIYRNSH